MNSSLLFLILMIICRPDGRSPSESQTYGTRPPDILESEGGGSCLIGAGGRQPTIHPLRYFTGRSKKSSTNRAGDGDESIEKNYDNSIELPPKSPIIGGGGGVHQSVTTLRLDGSPLLSDSYNTDENPTDIQGGGTTHSDDDEEDGEETPPSSTSRSMASLNQHHLYERPHFPATANQPPNRPPSHHRDHHQHQRHHHHHGPTTSTSHHQLHHLNYHQRSSPAAASANLYGQAAYGTGTLGGGGVGASGYNLRSRAALNAALYNSTLQHYHSQHFNIPPSGGGGGGNHYSAINSPVLSSASHHMATAGRHHHHHHHHQRHNNDHHQYEVTPTDSQPFYHEPATVLSTYRRGSNSRASNRGDPLAHAYTRYKLT